jgi:hypothetical protein
MTAAGCWHGKPPGRRRTKKGHITPVCCTKKRPCRPRRKPFFRPPRRSSQEARSPIPTPKQVSPCAERRSSVVGEGVGLCGGPVVVMGRTGRLHGRRGGPRLVRGRRPLWPPMIRNASRRPSVHVRAAGEGGRTSRYPWSDRARECHKPPSTTHAPLFRAHAGAVRDWRVLSRKRAVGEAQDSACLSGFLRLILVAKIGLIRLENAAGAWHEV